MLVAHRHHKWHMELLIPAGIGLGVSGSRSGQPAQGWWR